MGWPGPVTHRQYRLYETWLEWEWNRPSRADYYVMQGTRATLNSDAELGQFKIKYTTPQPMTAERRKQISEWGRVAWGISLGAL